MNGYFSYKRGARTYLLAYHRPCVCTQVEGEHEWSDVCDRFPPVVAEIDGEEVEALSVERLMADRDTSPIVARGRLSPAKEYAYLVAKKKWDTDKRREKLSDLKPIF
ncbi:hypothetical protein [uncultured Sneathiella sp.]|uniref:hypothetical protein n=1 Tax=uncultured Sneathiella sp. TaxID=879315 RepID=UPI0030ECF8A9|tara:strand:+ start:2240 stop:2560 length:321 start_codon:yes stop_codon:yes gene_type:complete